MNGRPSDLDSFPFYLATQLGMTRADVLQMDHVELVQWRAYYTAKHAMENQRPTGGAA